MPTAEADLDIKEFLSAEDHSFEKVAEFRRQIHCNIDRRSELEALVEEFGPIAKKLSSENKAEVRKAVALWCLGRVEEAVPMLEKARSSRERDYFLGISYLDLGRAADAVAPLKEAHSADSADLQALLALAEAELKSGAVESAEARVEKALKKHADNADALYVQGLIHDFAGNRAKAVESYEAALKAEPAHARSIFRLAYLYDMAGDDEGALELYEQLRKLQPVHVNTMLNLGLLYEDRAMFDEAAECYRSVLDYFPNHVRARINLRDAQASLTMYYDEEAIKREQKLQVLMGQSLADVSFSQRVRNALVKLNINTIGELASRSEEEMLGLPNFGKTSLQEIKEFLTGKGLSLSSGKTTAAAPSAPPAAPGIASPDVAAKPLADFEWSGRIKKVFEKMEAKTVGDLLKKSETELLKNKNLGATSIKEIRRKLGGLGVQMIQE